MATLIISTDVSLVPEIIWLNLLQYSSVLVTHTLVVYEESVKNKSGEQLSIGFSLLRSDTGTGGDMTVELKSFDQNNCNSGFAC